ncbi:MAG: malate dehydrogenase, partial [Ignavibacteria bacterium CG_4_9_14_0_2_um_filter_37_13]
KLNANGIEQILELKLTDQEIAGLKKSADDVTANIKKLDI